VSVNSERAHVPLGSRVAGRGLSHVAPRGSIASEVNQVVHHMFFTLSLLTAKGKLPFCIGCTCYEATVVNLVR
jgi:hypothetical protein